MLERSWVGCSVELQFPAQVKAQFWELVFKTQHWSMQTGSRQFKKLQFQISLVAGRKRLSWHNCCDKEGGCLFLFMNLIGFNQAIGSLLKARNPWDRCRQQGMGNKDWYSLGSPRHVIQEWQCSPDYLNLGEIWYVMELYQTDLFWNTGFTDEKSFICWV